MNYGQHSQILIHSAFSSTIWTNSPDVQHCVYYAYFLYFVVNCFHYLIKSKPAGILLLLLMMSQTSVCKITTVLLRMSICIFGCICILSTCSTASELCVKTLPRFVDGVAKRKEHLQEVWKEEQCRCERPDCNIKYLRWAKLA